MLHYSKSHSLVHLLPSAGRVSLNLTHLLESVCDGFKFVRCSLFPVNVWSKGVRHLSGKLKLTVHQVDKLENGELRKFGRINVTLEYLILKAVFQPPIQISDQSRRRYQSQARDLWSPPTRPRDYSLSRHGVLTTRPPSGSR